MADVSFDSFGDVLDCDKDQSRQRTDGTFDASVMGWRKAIVPMCFLKEVALGYSCRVLSDRMLQG